MEVKYSGYYCNIVLADFINLWLVMARGFLGMALFFHLFSAGKNLEQRCGFGLVFLIFSKKEKDMFLCRICNSN